MTDTHELQLHQLVNELAAILSSDHYFSTTPELIACETQRNPYSFTSRLQFSGGDTTKCYYVKIPIIDENNKDVVHSRLESELEYLRRLKNAFRDDMHLSVAAPIAYLERYPALVTEEVRGRTLHDILAGQTRLFGGGRSDCDTANLCRLSGMWLSKFQSTTALPL